MQSRRLLQAFVLIAVVSATAVLILRPSRPASSTSAGAPSKEARGAETAATASGDAALRSTRSTSATPSEVEGGESVHAPPSSPSGNPTRVAEPKTCTAEKARTGLCDECRTALDCPQGSACRMSKSSNTYVCEPNECSADADCGTGAACRQTFWPGRKAGVGSCIPDGLKTEGDYCVSNTSLDIEHTCAKGLLCVEHQCGQPCDPERPCPNGATCEPLYDEKQQSVCFKSCVPGQCPSGQECVRTGATATCAERIGDNCIERRCPPGQQCQVQANGPKVAFACRATCMTGPCPQGQICAALYGTWESKNLGIPLCYDGCDPKSPSCNRGQVCIPVDVTQAHFGCRYAF